MSYYRASGKDTMDDTKQNEEHQSNEPKKPLADQMTDMLATAAGVLAELP